MKNINHNFMYLFGISLCFLILILFSLPIHNRQTDSSPLPSSWDLSGGALVIDDSDPAKDWESYAQANPQWCTGSGTSADPYVISNLNIDALQQDIGIEIRNSEAYFELIECVVINVGDSNDCFGIGINFTNVNNGLILRCGAHSNTRSGISLYNCSNVQISDSFTSKNDMEGLFTGISRGISIYISSNIFVDSNTVYNNSGSGIYVKNCNNTRIENNYIERHSNGIFLIESSDNDIKNNEISQSSQSAVELTYKSVLNDIISNTIHHNEVGVLIEKWSHNNHIIGNSFSNNSYDIVIGDSCQNTSIKNNGDCDIYRFDDTTDTPPPPPPPPDPTPDPIIETPEESILILLYATIVIGIGIIGFLVYRKVKK